MSDEDAIQYYMEKHPDLKGCIATNETVTQLAIKTMDQLDAEKHITLVGFDAGKEQVNALKMERWMDLLCRILLEWDMRQ